MVESQFKTRFAPSPTGFLHLGNVRTALFNYLLAQQASGTFLLRLEDTDAVRGHERYELALLEDLRWLGLLWDEGPGSEGGCGPYVQSQRGAIYTQYMTVLERQGLAYPCFCTEYELQVERKTSLAAGRPPRYSGRCRTLSKSEIDARFARRMPATLRFHVGDNEVVEFTDSVRGPLTFNTSDIGDFVIRRSDGTPAFFFCNAVDDALMGVTLVVRGEDHLTNTPRQILLLNALSLSVPRYAHIALVVGTDGAPLSKRTGSKSVQELRTSGYLPVAINNYLARLGHTYEENRLLSLDQLAAHFGVERLHRSPARFDEAQLLYWQREAMRNISLSELWAWMGKETSTLVPESQRAEFIDAVRGNLIFPSDALRWARVIYTDDITLDRSARDAIDTASPAFFHHASILLDAYRADFAKWSAALKQATKTSGKALYQPLRAALTGEIDGPELVKLLPLIGLNRVGRRLREAEAATEEKDKK